ncbi:MAG: carbohydrate porin [Pseudomonadota bacterium]
MKHLFGLILLLGFCSFSAGADEVPASPVEGSGSKVTSSDYGDTLFGDWGEKRGAMSENGYDWEIVYKLDLFSKVTSSNQTGCIGHTPFRCFKNYGLDNLDIKLSLDGEKIAGIKGSSALLYILSNHGGKPVVQGDHTAGLDNIETPEGANTIKLYQAWIQQTFLDERLSILAGLYDLNSEFYATESSSMFIQPVYGIGAEMAGTGQNGPSVFPTASFGIRAKAEFSGYYLQAVVLDGVPGDPNNPHGTHVQFNKGDGALDVIEGAIPLSDAENAHDNKLALGVWQYTASFDDLVDLDISSNPVKRINHGYYALIEKVLRYKPGGNEGSINGFVRAGRADGNTTQFDLAWSTGLVFSGPFAGREQDQLGIAYAQERNGDKWRIYSGNPIVFEKSMELTYRYQATPGLVLQPLAQYLINHSSDPAQDKNWWLAMRFEATF